MTDHIVLTGVRGTGHHGVFELERREGQVFLVDVDLVVDLAAAGRSDALADTVHYGEVAADIVARIEGEPRDLVERLAEDIAADCLARPLVEAVEVTVHKPQAPVGVPFGDVHVRIQRVRPHSPVVVGVGANLGDAATTVREAMGQVVSDLALVSPRMSRLYRTQPVGGPDQPAYVNAVVVGESRLTPPRLLALLHEIEDGHGRTREIRWGARTLDLDLVQYGNPADQTDVTSDDPALTLPHPRAHERGFVLVPWLEADPRAVLRTPDGPRPVAELVGRVDVSGVRPWQPVSEARR